MCYTAWTSGCFGGGSSGVVLLVLDSQGQLVWLQEHDVCSSSVRIPQRADIPLAVTQTPALAGGDEQGGQKQTGGGGGGAVKLPF